MNYNNTTTIAELSDVLSRTEFWIVVELTQSGIRRERSFNALTVDELERFVAYLKNNRIERKISDELTWRRATTNSWKTNIGTPLSVAPNGGDVCKKLTLDILAKRAIVLILRYPNHPLLGALHLVRLPPGLDETSVRNMINQKSSKVPIKAAALDFLKSTQFNDVLLELRKEIQDLVLDRQAKRAIVLILKFPIYPLPHALPLVRLPKGLDENSVRGLINQKASKVPVKAAALEFIKSTQFNDVLLELQKEIQDSILRNSKFKAESDCYGSLLNGSSEKDSIKFGLSKSEPKGRPPGFGESALPFDWWREKN